jgi:hypothetical protein
MIPEALACDMVGKSSTLVVARAAPSSACPRMLLRGPIVPSGKIQAHNSGLYSIPSRPANDDRFLRGGKKK